MMMEKSKKVRAAHQHGWIYGLIGLVAGLLLLIYVPSLKPVAQSLILFAGFHIVGALVLLATIWYGGLRTHLHRPSNRSDRIDFGWDPGWTGGLAVTSLIALSAAVAVEVAMPAYWPLAWFLLLNAFSFFVGFLGMSGSHRREFAVLPVADFLSGPRDLVLDAGCGAGRTSITLGPALRDGRIVAIDRFDADYIKGGGRALLEQNLKLCGLTDRVQIETGDLTALAFPDGHFDSIVSTNVYDHLGTGKQAAVNEAARVLRPGGRFLMGVSAPGWAMFAVGNVLSFFLPSRRFWRKTAEGAGLAVAGEWEVNGTWFVLFAKPGSRTRAEALTA